MTTRPAIPADLPPAGLPGLDPAWSRLVPVVDADGVTRTFHVLDTHPDGADVVGTLLCVHGNPTWSYLWRRLLADPPEGWRVIAPDHLGMGHSERLDTGRTLAQRVDDLGRLTAVLGLDGPVVTVAHDWGGILSTGWALEHPGQLRGMVLTNTAVHQPEPGRGPVLIRAAHVPAVRAAVCVRTPAFVRATTSLTRPLPSRAVRDAYAEPYRRAARRTAVGDFVADIPFAADHPSRPALDDVSGRMRELDVPALLLWGPRDPVFGEEHLRDLQDRLPRAVTHRYPHASHLLPEDAPEYVAAVGEFLRSLDDAPRDTAADVGLQAPQVWARLTARADDDSPAVLETDGSSTSWRELHRRVVDVAGGLVAAGVRPGDRVALLVPPSTDLTVAAYAAWQAGATIVVADRGLGLRGMGRALRGARVDHVIGAPQGLAAARAMRLPGGRFGTRRLPGGPATLQDLANGRHGTLPEVDGDLPAAVLFTSGSTGPAKGVLYRHHQLRAQVDLVHTLYRLTDEDRLVAAFAPFSVFGPALGIASSVPDVDVTAPGDLTAPLLADAVARAGATVVFASPAALRRVVDTADGLDTAGRRTLATVRLLMSAGAPVPLPLLRRLAELLPGADLRTPYGMTEALPVTDVSLTELEEAGVGNGVCVGSPVPGTEVAVRPLGTDELLTDAGVTGEVCVRAAHVKDRYDALWMTERAASRTPGWHRTGDVGHLDERGRLWIEGRVVHVLHTPDGPLTPVGLEQRVEALPGVASAAVVGVGPAGTQQVVVVLSGGSGPLADPGAAAEVRAVAGVPVAAVLTRSRFPVDVRHASKIDRTALAAWADEVLAGSR